MKTLKDNPSFEGKKVIVRVDFNVPLGEDGQVKDDKRMKIALPTLRVLLEKNVAQIILITHVGRPKGSEPHLRTNAIAAHLEKLLEKPVVKVDDWGENGLPEDKIIFLENVRFHPAEKSKDANEREAFGRQMAGLADFYVNEAFSNSHRNHASMTGIPKFIPGFAGLGVEKEVKALQKAIQNPAHPLVAVIGGLKADKLPAIDYLMNVADHILVAGALAFTLLKAQGFDVGNSKVDSEGMMDLAPLVSKITQSDKVVLPQDAVVANAFSAEAEHKAVSIDSISGEWMALDIGPKTIEHYTQILDTAQTILWFGPIGVFEMEPYSHGTRAIGQAMAESGATTLVGGGDSAGAVAQLGLEDQMSLVSTGGGASLQIIEGKTLPAIEILST